MDYLFRNHFNHQFDYHCCNFCPRQCKVNRYNQLGYCKSPAAITVARAALHLWEEPCISGVYGSGTVFFSGCTLKCCFCQNYKISSEGFGIQISTGRLADIFLELQEKNAHNINLVTAAQFLPSVIEALAMVKGKLLIPVVYNCGGYETVDAIKALAPYVDIWLPDLKYLDSGISDRYSDAADYFEIAKKALGQMISQSGGLVFEDFNGISLMKKGVILRHMILPGHKDDSIRLMHFIHDSLAEGTYLLSLLSQYTPFYKSIEYPEINRRITTYEYEKVLDTAISLGLTRGYMQRKSSAKEEYTPSFDLEGINIDT